MSDKLHIPGSADQEDFTELNIVLVLGWAACMLLCIGLFLFFRERRPESANQLSATQAHAAEDEEPKTAREKTVEAIRFGPRGESEPACGKLRPQLASGELAAEIDLELLKVVDRRAKYAPWTCLMGAYLDGEVSSELQVHAELAKFWRQAQTFQVPPEITASMLKGFYLSKTTPQNSEFSHWLRLCGMTPTFRARPACLQLMRRGASAQGNDVLEMVEKHLEVTDAPTLAREMPKVAEGLGDFATDGQPDIWKIEKTDTIEDYNRDLRIGAAFMLCRIVNSPDEKAANAAAIALAEAANMAARVADPKMLRRWRETCQLVFNREDDTTDEDTLERDAAQKESTQKDALEVKPDLQERVESAPPTPTGTHVLAVWTGEEDSPPDYTLRHAVERGGCAAKQGYPIWYCGLRYWQGEADESFDLSLQNFFVKTSYIEWLDE